MTLSLLVADCETADARARRRRSVGASAGESFAALLARLAPDATAAQLLPADAGVALPTAEALAAYDGVVLTGSPLHVYDGSGPAERVVAFMRHVFASGTPSFGSCAGLQIAVAAAGGTVRPAGPRQEAGFARDIWLTEAGARHPLLQGRLRGYTALTLHGDEVAALPDGATLLAANDSCTVQAAEIRHGPGVFWGVQYHPELSLGEIAGALRRDAESLVEGGLAPDEATIGAHADLIDALAAAPDRRDLRWRLGLGDEVVHDERRHREVRNFLDHLVRLGRGGGRA